MSGVSTRLMVVEVASVTLLTRCNVEELAAPVPAQLHRSRWVISVALLRNSALVLHPVEAQSAVIQLGLALPSVIG